MAMYILLIGSSDIGYYYMPPRLSFVRLKAHYVMMLADIIPLI